MNTKQQTFDSIRRACGLTAAQVNANAVQAWAEIEDAKLDAVFTNGPQGAIPDDREAHLGRWFRVGLALGLDPSKRAELCPGLSASVASDAAWVAGMAMTNDATAEAVSQMKTAHPTRIRMMLRKLAAPKTAVTEQQLRAMPNDEFLTLVDLVSDELQRRRPLQAGGAS